MDGKNVAIYTGTQFAPKYRELGPVKARVTSKTIFSRQRTEEEVNQKLSSVAANMGANAVINVIYSRGVSFTSWKALTAQGIAVVAETPPMPSQ